MLAQRVVDAFQAFPTLILAIAVVAALGSSTTNVIIALTAASWPGIARVVRAQVLSLKGGQFVEAARSIGVDVAVLRAVTAIEARGTGFIAGTDLPLILFEGHHFHRRTGGRYARDYPSVSYPKWDRSKYRGSRGEYGDSRRCGRGAQYAGRWSASPTRAACIRAVDYARRIQGATSAGGGG